MNKLTTLFYPKEIKEVLAELKALWQKYDTFEFRENSSSCIGILKAPIYEQIKINKKDMLELIKNGTSPKVIALRMVVNISGEFAVSGEFNVQLNFFNPRIGGHILKKVYFDAMDQLTDLSDTTKERAERNKKLLVENMEFTWKTSTAPTY